VSGHAEPHVAQRFHDVNLVSGDCPHAVGRVVWRTRRRAAVAESSKIGHDDRESLGEPWSHSMPHQMCLGQPVQQ
jgi:hypothetical protein